jgi:hypothetical protein
LPPLKKLIKQCWHAKPSRRPTFQKCIEALKKIIEIIPATQKQQQTLNLASLHRSSIERPVVTDKKVLFNTLFNDKVLLSCIDEEQ